MANSIDFTTLAVGTLIGMGCKKQLKSAAKITASLAASLAGATATAVAEAAEQINKNQSTEQDPQGQQAQNPQNGN